MATKRRPWHYHPTPYPGEFKVYRDGVCPGFQKNHGKAVGYVNKVGDRKWMAVLFGGIAVTPTLVGRGRTRAEAVIAAVAEGGIPRVGS